MRQIHILFLLTLSSLLAVSCQRENEYVAPAPNPIGGKGGTTVLQVTAKHHEKVMDSCTVYIRYDMNTMPKDGKWDDTMNVMVQNGRYMAVFPALKQGSYYLYGKGWDFDINQQVVGGAAFRVIDTATRTYDVYLNVTEPHKK